MAALYVFIFHLMAGGYAKIHSMKALSEFFFNASAQFFRFGDYAVDLFFILSGFVLSWVYLPGGTMSSWPSYWRARVGRIIPLYYLTTILMVLPLISWLKHGLVHGDEALVVKLLLNTLLLAGIFGDWHLSFNGPAWSISVEFFCYLCIFPLLVWCQRFLNTRNHGLKVCILSVCLISGLDAVCYSMPPIPVYMWHWDGSHLFRGILGFSAGFILCHVYRKSLGLNLQTRSINRILPVLAVLFLLIQFDVLPVYLTLCFLPLVVFVTAFDRGRVADILKKEPFQWLGERSYSVYLWHWPCMMGMHAVLHSHVPAVIYYVAVIAVVLGISELSYRYFECPLRDFIKNSASNKKLVKPQIGAILPLQTP